MLKALLFLLKPILRSAIELLFYAPIWLTLGLYTLEPSGIILLVIVLLVIYSAPQYMFHSGRSIKNGLRLLLIIVLGILPSGCIAIFMPDQAGPLSLLTVTVIGIAFATSSFVSLRNGWDYSFSTSFMLFLLLAALIVQLLKVFVLAKLADYNALYYSLAIAACIIFLYVNNERTIRSQQMINETSSTIRRSIAMNRIYITLFTLIVVAIAWFRGVQEKIEAWFKSLIELIMGWLFQEREAEQIVQEELPTNMVNPFDSLGEEKGPSPFWVLLEQIFKWLTIAVCVLAVIALIYYAITKLIPMLLKYIHRILNHRALLKMSDEGYQDEIEGIVPEKTTARQHRRKSSRPVDFRKWKKLSNADRLKLLYVQALELGLKEGKPIANSKTVNENLQLIVKDSATQSLYGKLSSLYNRMRYGNKDPELDQVEQLREQLEQHRKQ